MPEFTSAFWLETASFVLPLIIAITFHEAPHGFVAKLFGDPTAKEMGRMTFNPIKHIDRFGTIVLPGLLMLAKSPILFGYAKPVPVDASRLRNPKLHMVWVALAGPGINIVLAIVSAFLLYVPVVFSDQDFHFYTRNMINSVVINCVLAIFNMLPILPLDGGRVISGLLPDKLSRQYQKTERHGLIIVFLLLLIPALMQQFGMIEKTLLSYVVGMPTEHMANYILDTVALIIQSAL